MKCANISPIFLGRLNYQFLRINSFTQCVIYLRVVEIRRFPNQALDRLVKNIGDAQAVVVVVVLVIRDSFVVVFEDVVEYFLGQDPA
jgi:hypothetical protein